MTSESFVVSGVRLTHARASVDQLTAAAHADPADRIAALVDRAVVAEAAVVQTCNRVEEYVVTDAAADGRAALDGFATGSPRGAVVRMDHQQSLRHLLRVAAGLDSQILGEDEVLGQVRSAYTLAEEAGGLGPVLETALLKAIHVGERARTETGINEGIVSLGSAAVELADREHGLGDRTVAVVGAGAMARTALSALVDRGVDDLRLLNRTLEHVEALASELDVDAHCASLDALGDHLEAADVVITSTASPDPVVDRERVEAAGPTLFVDLAQPRDVAPDAAAAPGAVLKDLDDLEAITRATHEERREAARAVEAIIDEEFDLLVEGLKRRRADAVIRAMYQGAERIKAREVSRAVTALEARGDLNEDQRAAVESLGDALVSQLLAVPTKSLREAAAEDDWETISTALDLFDPALDGTDAAELLAALPEAPEGVGADTGGRE